MQKTLYELQPAIIKFRRAVNLTINKCFLPPTPIPGGRMSNGFIYVLEGRTLYDFGEYTIEVKSGDIIFLPKGSSYSMDILTNKYAVIFVNFDLSLTEGATLKAQAFPASNGKNTEKLFQKILTTWQMHSDLVATECMATLYAIYTDFLRATWAGYLPFFKRERMEKAMSYINEHLHEPSLNIPAIAKNVQMSDGHFRRQFKEVYGTSPVQYINMRRIALIKEDLRYSVLSIAQIAEKYSFSDVYYFSHMFKKEAGCSPSDYRKRHKQDTSI